MDRIFQKLRPFIRAAVTRAPWVLAIGALFAVVGLYFAVQLRIDTDFSKLIPESYESVKALERLRDTVGGESTVDVGIESPSFEANKAFSERLIEEALKLQRADGDVYFTRADYRKDTEFLENNALYFATTEELYKVEDYLADLIEDSRLEANPFFFDLEDEDEEDADPDSTAEELKEVYDQIVTKEYPISDDSTTLVVRFIPGGSQTNIGYIRDLYADLDELIAWLEPTQDHPEMQVTVAGRLLRQYTEVDAIQRDVAGSLGVGIATVLLFVVLYFAYKAYRARAGQRFSGRVFAAELARIPVMALVIGLPLLMSLMWTFGIAYLAFETLNLMTSTLGLVLFGLGIDYGIHFYARYTEERGQGHSIVDAAEITFTSTGQAITIGALTTAAALYVLVFADFKGFSEFGFIAGTGILLALVAMLIVMPALIAVLERLRLLNLNAAPDESGDTGTRRSFRGAKGVVWGSLGAVVLAIVLLPRVEFEYRFGELEPVYEAYNAKREVIRKVYDNRGQRNPAYIVLDGPEEAPAVVEAIRAYAEQDTLTPTIRKVESLQDRFPTTTDGQADKLDHIAYIRELLDDPFITQEESEDLDRLRRAAQTREPIAIEQVPEFMRKQFTSKSGEIGNFVIVYPSVGLSDGRLSMAFADDVGRVVTEDGTEYFAGSTSLVGADMLRLMQREAPWMIGATFIIVVLLMKVNFKRWRWALLALLPLVVGVLWMLLVMELLGLRLNFYNLIVLPAVLGIGNDAGAHMVHRYLEEGKGSILHVLRSTGEHIAMGSLTTMIGFAGPLLSFHPGLSSIGELAVVGLSTTLISAVLFLPALIQWLENRKVLHPQAHIAPVTDG